MGYVGVLLIAILISFIVVRIGALALQFTGMEATSARFQALSAFTGTGFTTTEAERVVRNRTRRRIITVLVILGNAGLVAIIGSLVVSFTQVTGYGWFFIRLAVIIVGIFILYRLVLASQVGNRVLHWMGRPLARRMMRSAPEVEEVFSVGKDWGVSLVTVKEDSKKIGSSLTDIAGAGDIDVLAIYRAEVTLTKPGRDERLASGDRLLVYASGKSIKQFLSG